MEDELGVAAPAEDALDRTAEDEGAVEVEEVVLLEEVEFKRVLQTETLQLRRIAPNVSAELTCSAPPTPTATPL